MCGRTALALEPEEIRYLMGGAPWYDQHLYNPGYNVPPTHYQPVILHRDAAKDIERIAADKTKTETIVDESYNYIKRKVVTPGENKMDNYLDSMSELGKYLKIKSMKWGLLPTWSTFKGPKTIIPINIRDDSLTVNNKPMFNRLKNSNRCCVLAQGFFEWKRTGKGKTAQKIPHFTHLPDNAEQPLVLLGALYDQIKINGQTTFSYAVVTTQANEAFSSIHDRMPLIFDPVLDQDKILKWLSPRVPFNDTIKQMLVPYESPLITYEVSSGVNNVQNDEPSFILPVLEQQINEDAKKRPAVTLNSFFAPGKRERPEDDPASRLPRKWTAAVKEEGATKDSPAQRKKDIKAEAGQNKIRIKAEPEIITLDSD